MHEIRTTSFEAVKRKLDQIVIGTMHCVDVCQCIDDSYQLQTFSIRYSYRENWPATYNKK